MPVIIDTVSTDVIVDPAAGGARGGGGEADAAPETQADDLRAVIREILREELERALRLALPQR